MLLSKGRRNYQNENRRRKQIHQKTPTFSAKYHFGKNVAEIPNLGFSTKSQGSKVSSDKNNKSRSEQIRDTQSYSDLLQTIEDYAKTYTSVSANPESSHRETSFSNSNESSIGSRSDISFPITDEIWEDIASDHEQTLRSRCPHYIHNFITQQEGKVQRHTF